VGTIADKPDEGMRNPIKPEAFIPYTLVMGMGDADSGAFGYSHYLWYMLSLRR